MKTFSISLEKLRTGEIRVTGRLEGRTVTCAEGTESHAKQLVQSVMEDTCGHLQNGLGEFDMDYISLNEMASNCLK